MTRAFSDMIQTSEQYWIICAARLRGDVSLCEASHPVSLFTGWTGEGRPIATAFHHYAAELAKAERFSRDQVDGEVALVQKIAGPNYHVFSIPLPQTNVLND